MIEHFEIAIPDSVLADLDARLASIRLPTNGARNWSAGTNSEYLRELVDYWRQSFDWREHEARLNQFKQFVDIVDGTKLHFIHERGHGPAPLPLILTHGYPDCFFRFYK